MGPFRVLQISIVVLMLFGSTLVVRVVGLAAAPSGSSSTWLQSNAALAGPLLQGDNGDNDNDGGGGDDNADNTDADNGGDNGDDNDEDDNDNGDDYDDNDNFDDFDFVLPPPPAPARPPQPACAQPGQETAFTSFDEKVTVRVFPSTPQPIKVEILQIIDFLSAPLPPGNLVGLLAYEIQVFTCDGARLAQFPAEVNLGIRYGDLEATGLDESRFVIGRLDLATATWKPVEKRANDPSSNYTSATIIDPGYFMVWETR